MEQKTALKKLISDSPWRTSHNPEYHQYIVDEQNILLFDKIKAMVYSEGYTAFFMDEPYKYVDIDNFRYWICDNILNRCPNSYNSKYFKKE